MLSFIDDENESVCLSAANALKNKKDKRIIESLLKSLNSESTEVRRHSVYILGEIGDSKAVDPIIGKLNDNSVDRVLALESAQHFKPLSDFLSESKRILTKV